MAQSTDEYGYPLEYDPNGNPKDGQNSNQTGQGSIDFGNTQGSQGPLQNQPTQPAPTWSPGANAGQNVTLLGFETAKLENPNAGNPEVGKYNDAVRTFYNGLKQDVGLSRGGLDNMVNYIRANGFANARAVGDDKIDFGDGNGPIDVIRSDGQIVFQNTSGNPVWEQAHGYTPGGQIAQMMTGGQQSTGDQGLDARIADIMAGQPTWSYDDAKAWALRYWVPQAAQTPAPTTPTGPAPGTPGGGAPEADHVPDTNELLRMLLARADQSLNIDRNDPIIKNQSDSYKAQAERARRNYLADQAEQGGPYNQGQMASAERNTSEQLGRDVGGFEANLMQQELTARRGEIQDALNSMGSLLTEQQRQALQKELAQLDASIRRQQMDMQNSQFMSQLSQQDRQFLAQLAQQGRFADMDDAFRRAQLGQQDSQWRDQFGFDQTKYYDDLDAKQRGL